MKVCLNEGRWSPSRLCVPLPRYPLCNRLDDPPRCSGCGGEGTGHYRDSKLLLAITRTAIFMLSRLEGNCEQMRLWCGECLLIGLPTLISTFRLRRCNNYGLTSIHIPPPPPFFLYKPIWIGRMKYEYNSAPWCTAVYFINALKKSHGVVVGHRSVMCRSPVFNPSPLDFD